MCVLGGQRCDLRLGKSSDDAQCDTRERESPLARHREAHCAPTQVVLQLVSRRHSVNSLVVKTLSNRPQNVVAKVFGNCISVPDLCPPTGPDIAPVE